MKSVKLLAPLALLLLGSKAYAVPCEDTTTGVFLTDSTTQAWSDCLNGTGNNDPYPSELSAFGMTYTALYKINYAEGGGQDPDDEKTNIIDLVITPDNAATEGTWSFTNIAAYTDYVIVLKDGGTYPDGVNWGAYLLNSDLFSSTAGSTWSGDWIYGYGQTGQGDKSELKKLSHLSVYGKFVDDGGGGPPEEIPIPGTLLLLGLGLLGLRFRPRA